MKGRQFLHDSSSWRRKGIGRRFDFFATDDDIQSWLNLGLPLEYRSYFLCGPSLGKQSATAANAGFIIGPEDFLQHREREASDWEYWLFSEKLTSLNAIRSRLTEIDRMASINGLVLLQHGQYNREKMDASSLCVVDKVVNINTLEERQFKEYLGIYNSLKRVIKADLVYSTKHVFPDGKVLEDERLLMTENVVASINNGARYINDVGRALMGEKR